MRVAYAPTLLALLLIFSLSLCLPSTAEAAAWCRCLERGSTIEALGEEFPELTAWFGGIAILSGLPELGYWVTCDALGEEYPERSSSSQSEALGEEFPERFQFSDDLEALGEEFPE